MEIVNLYRKFGQALVSETQCSVFLTEYGGRDCYENCVCADYGLVTNCVCVKKRKCVSLNLSSLFQILWRPNSVSFSEKELLGK